MAKKPPQRPYRLHVTDAEGKVIANTTFQRAAAWREAAARYRQTKGNTVTTWKRKPAEPRATPASPEPGSPAQEKRDFRAPGQRFKDAEAVSAAQDAFLEAFGNSGVVLVGCRAANIHRTTVDYWSEHDAEFSVRYGLARRDADDRLRAEIVRRAVQGVQRPNGVTLYSDNLLMFHAKARMPEYKDQETRVKLVVDDDAVKVLSDIINRTVTDEETLARIRAEFARLANQG